MYITYDSFRYTLSLTFAISINILSGYFRWLDFGMVLVSLDDMDSVSCAEKG